MSLEPEEILREARRYTTSDWSVKFLWLSVFVSVTMVTGTMMWNLGKSLRIEHFLKEQSIQTCVELHLPPTQKALATSEEVDELLTQSCEQLVGQHHQRCLDSTSSYPPERLNERSADYTMCVIEQGQTRAALDK